MKSKFMKVDGDQVVKKSIETNMGQTSKSGQSIQNHDDLYIACQDVVISRHAHPPTLDLEIDSAVFDLSLNQAELLLKASLTAYTELLEIDKVYLFIYLSIYHLNRTLSFQLTLESKHKNKSDVAGSQSVQVALKTIDEVSVYFRHFGEIFSTTLGIISPEQARGLSSLSFFNIIIMYLNLPNCNQSTTQYGINHAMDGNFICRFPHLIESYQQIKAELTQWNPSFVETALLTVMIFINCYSGNDLTMTNIQQQTSKVCDCILWKLSGGDGFRFGRLRMRFFDMIKLLQQTKDGLFSALEIASKNANAFGKFYSSMRQAETDAERLIESK